MRTRKIRGYKRRDKHIEKWRLNNLSFDLKSYLLKESDRCYVKIRIYPWHEISFMNSMFPIPKGKIRQKILSGLLDIYDNWKTQLDELGQPYYLKIWLFEPRFLQSQVVCAIGDNIDFYKDTFFKPVESKMFRPDKYGSLKQRLEKLNWSYRRDEDHYDNSEIQEPAKRLKRPHRTVKLERPIGDVTEIHSFKRGEVWLGG